MNIAGVGHAFPSNFYTQTELLAAAEAQWGDQLFNTDRLARLFDNVLVGGRHLALPLDEYPALASFGAANDAWIRVGLEVGAEAVERALAQAGLTPVDVDALFTVTVTGVATPSLDARLMNRLEFRPDLKRIPIFGLGCVAGAAGIARAADYLRAFPDQIAVLLSVELCSLTLQREDLSMASLVSAGLFGDGAAAVVLVGAERAAVGPRVAASRSSFYPGTEHVMGWDISERGFKILLSAEVPAMVRRHLRRDVEAFLAAHDSRRDDISSWIAHTGGPKVLEAVEEALELPPDALELAWKSLREVGNLSSTSVLLVLEETMAGSPPAQTRGLLFAMGPGFCSELVLLEW
ncbi:MAG: type III polyketide synthase [Acidobacteria bacterium]|nr:type III polyketide synthase [Acidobacteriota bacterium]